MRVSLSKIEIWTGSILSPSGCGRVDGFVPRRHTPIGRPWDLLPAGVDDDQRQVGAQAPLPPQSQPASGPRADRCWWTRVGALLRLGRAEAASAQTSISTAMAPPNTLYFTRPQPPLRRPPSSSAADLVVLHHNVEILDPADLVDGVRDAPARRLFARPACAGIFPLSS